MVCILNFLQELITFENVTCAECSMNGGGGGGRGEKGRPYLNIKACHLGAKKWGWNGETTVKEKRGSLFSPLLTTAMQAKRER